MASTWWERSAISNFSAKSFTYSDVSAGVAAAEEAAAAEEEAAPPAAENKRFDKHSSKKAIGAFINEIMILSYKIYFLGTNIIAIYICLSSTNH